jgi:O-antigen/teichoic acid export membrane protein
MVWIPGFLLIAKGENKLFLTIEVLGNILLLTFSILFYKYFGLVGLGYALVSYFVISTVFTLVIIYWKFKLSYSIKVWSLFVLTLLSVTICLVLKTQIPYPYSLILELTFSFLVVVFTLYQVNKRVNLLEFAMKFLRRVNK